MPDARIRRPGELSDLLGLPLSGQQLAAATAPLEPGVIVAGAGTGKTTVMAARVVWLVASGQVAPDAVLGLTFTNKAAAELEQRIATALRRAGLLQSSDLPRTLQRPGEPDDGEEQVEPTVLTYHAYAGRLLAEHGIRIGHEPDTRLIVDASRYQLAARVVAAHPGPFARLSTHLPTVVTYLLALDAQLNDHLLSVDEVRRFTAQTAERWMCSATTAEPKKAVNCQLARLELLDLVEQYRDLKQHLGVMDFSDQMSLAARLAEQCHEVGELERGRFGVVLLDEYQDTSVAQTRMLQRLFSGPSSARGGGHPVTAVGDPCQAIYGWRGASVSNIERFPDDFRWPADHGERVAARFPLSINRRSRRHILDTANQVATDLYSAFHGVEPLQPHEGADAGRVRAALFETIYDELAFLAREVPAAHSREPGRKWSDIAVLVRDNKTAGRVHEALAAADVPVEVVGLSGLLSMPEVREVVATLEVLEDVTDNAALLHLLTGPRWAVGVRDLALLGQRARQLARYGDRAAADDVGDADRADPGADSGDDLVPKAPEEELRQRLAESVAGVDPADVVSLVEALDRPGNLEFSAAARERFAALSSELRELRRHVGEPLLDLVHRVIETIGLDVELAASQSPLAAVRRDNLATFVDAVAAFAGVDAEAGLGGLIAYLEAEEQYGQGLQLAIPSESDSVKLLTVHRAKGLEWDVVFVPGMTKCVFPSDQGRNRWTTYASELPWPLRGDADDLPTLDEPLSSASLKAFKEDCQRHDLLEERRLGYVAVTRPRSELVVSAYWWGPTQSKVRGPSELFDDVIAAMAAWGQQPEVCTPQPEDDSVNPLLTTAGEPKPWPVEARPHEVAHRRAAADLVGKALADGWAEASRAADEELTAAERVKVDSWDRELDRLVEEAVAASADEIVVPLPATLSATTLMRLADDPERLARDLARPMPRKPSRAARFGTRFHALLEAHFGQQQLIDADDLPGRADEGIADEAELQELTRTFLAGPFGEWAPHRFETPFSLVLAGQVVRGRIDAVYSLPGGGAAGSGISVRADGNDSGARSPSELPAEARCLVVDWKTNVAETADPLQLAIYRLAWAELNGLPVDQVAAAFYYVRTNDVVVHTDLPDRPALESLLPVDRPGLRR